MFFQPLVLMEGRVWALDESQRISNVPVKLAELGASALG